MMCTQHGVMLLALTGGLAALAAGCGTTKAATPGAADEKKVVEKAAVESIDHNLAREAERWMIEQAKKRAADQGGPPPQAKQGAVPATAR